MAFNSISYLFFLLISLGVYWGSPQKIKIILICVLSAIFYSLWSYKFLGLIFLSIIVDFYIALEIEKTNSKTNKKRWLLLSILFNLLILFYFKYLFFIQINFIELLNIFGYEFSHTDLKIILPLGISFYTFEAISYVVDVYRKKIPAEKNLLTYSGFILFFPKLIAGPVLRASDMIPELSANKKFDPEIFISGIKRLLYGLFLKVVIADNIAPFVDTGFSQEIATLSAIDVWTLAFLFGFQIYFDFSAYSSIAIGSARLFGINIPENFNYPYLSKSPKEFWQRWHISLSSWVRDYIYFPLKDGYGDKPKKENNILLNKKYQNVSAIYSLILTWVIMGLWHGASWTFALWGLYHALVILIARLFSFKPSNCIYLNNFISWSLTLGVMMLGWIPFRAKNVEDTIEMWKKLFYFKNYLWLGLRENTYIITTLMLVFCLLSYYVHQKKYLFSKNKIIEFGIQSLVMTVVISLTFIFLRPINQFIYFQF